MRRKGWILVIFGAVTWLLAGLIVVSAAPLDGQALVKISVRRRADLGLVESAGVPVYARATGDAGPYLLAGATSQQEAALQARGLEVTTLDSDVGGAKYYLVQLRPGRAQPDWAC